MMTTIVGDGFTVVGSQALRDPKLSSKAKGLYAMIASLPENWDFSIRGLASICRDKKTTIGRAIEELEDEGYLVRLQMRNKQGQFMKCRYVLTDGYGSRGHREVIAVRKFRTCTDLTGRSEFGAG